MLSGDPARSQGVKHSSRVLTWPLEVLTFALSHFQDKELVIQTSISQSKYPLSQSDPFRKIVYLPFQNVKNTFEGISLFQEKYPNTQEPNPTNIYNQGSISREITR